MRQKLDDIHVANALKLLPGWSRSGDAIARTYDTGSFTNAITLVNELAKVAEELNHHPDIDIRYARVRVVCSTHDAHGLTHLDFDLARRADELAASI